MGNEEFKEIIDELFKFLRDKICLSYGQYLSDECKERLFSFETENIIINNDLKKIVQYMPQENKIQVSVEFLNPMYIEKIKSKNTDFDLEDLKNRVNEENPKILLEELIAFSKELNIHERDLIKSLLIQEILKMVLYKEEINPKEDVVITGAIELLAHNIGSQNGFLVSTPKKYLGELEVAIGLKEELEDNFESVVLSGNVLDYLSRIENRRLIEKLDGLTDNRKIIESTQNLDNVIDSIINMTEKTEGEIKNTEEEKDSSNSEEIVDLDRTMKVEKIEENINKEVEDLSKKEETMNQELKETNNSMVNSKSGSKKIILSILGVLLIVLLGILLGYLLFKFK